MPPTRRSRRRKQLKAAALELERCSIREKKRRETLPPEKIRLLPSTRTMLEGAIPLLVSLIGKNDEAVSKEVCWTLSNLFRQNPAMIKTDIAKTILDLLLHKSPSVAFPAVRTIVTMMESGNDAQAKETIEAPGSYVLLMYLYTYKRWPCIRSVASRGVHIINCYMEKYY